METKKIMENRRNARFSQYLRPEADAAGRNVSWGSILAGVVTFFALLLTFSFIGSAIGFGVTDVTSDNPFDGVGTGLIIWGILTLILSLFAAGFVSGVTSARTGLIHGFLTWATSVILLFSLLTFTTINTFQTVGSVLGTVGSAAGSGISTVASGASNAVTNGFSAISDNVTDVDTEELQGNVEEILRDTDIEELQPEYLQGQLDAAREDATEAGKQVLTNPENFDQIVADLGDKLTERAETIEQSVDEQEIADAVAQNTDLTQAEAEEATQNIVDGLNQATTQASEQIQNAQQTLQETSQQLETQIEELRVQTEQATETASKVSIWSFVALILTMILTSIAGIVGSSTARRDDTVNR